MTLSDGASLAMIVQTIFVVVSLGFVWYQLRETGRLTKAANTQRSLEILHPWLLTMAQDPELAALWLQGAKIPETLNEVDRWRYNRLLIYLMKVYENVHHQWSEKLIDTPTYSAWKTAIDRIIAEQWFEQRWDGLKPSFEPSFAQYVEQQLKKTRSS